MSSAFISYWTKVEIVLSRSLTGLCFALDPATVPPSLHLSNSSLTITCQGEDPPGPPPDDKVRRSRYSDPECTPPEVCGDVIIARGQYYWEVDVCNSSLYRIGKNSLSLALVGFMPALLSFPESCTVSQQAYLSPQSRTNEHAHILGN